VAQVFPSKDIEDNGGKRINPYFSGFCEYWKIDISKKEVSASLRRQSSTPENDGTILAENSSEQLPGVN